MKSRQDQPPRTRLQKTEYLLERLLFAAVWWLLFMYFTPIWARVITAVLGTIALATFGAAAWLLLWRDRQT